MVVSILSVAFPSKGDALEPGSDASDFLTPLSSRLFENVERIYLYVDYNAPFVDEDKIPMLLQRDAIEKLVFNAYKYRFSQEFCNKTFGKGEGDCKNQPITTIKNKNKSSFLRREGSSVASEAELKADGSLYVYFSVSIINNFSAGYPPKPVYEPLLVDPIVIILVDREVVGDDVPLLFRKPISVAFPLSQSGNVMKRKLAEVTEFIIK